MLYKKILLALDGTDDETSVIKEAVRVTKALEAKLSIVHVNDPAAGKPHLMMDTLPLTTEDEIRALIKKAGFKTISEEVKVTIIESAQYAKEIAGVAEKADLLVIGHRSKNKIQAVVTDSTDERVADLVTCPMLVVPCVD